MVYYFTSDSNDCICIFTGRHRSEVQPPAANTKIGVVGGREVIWDYESGDGVETAFTQIKMFLNPRLNYMGVFWPCRDLTEITLTARSVSDLDVLKGYCTTLRVIHPGLKQMPATK